MSELTVGSRAVQVRELTVAEIRAWLKSAEDNQAEFEVVSRMLFDDCDFDTLALMTDLSVDDMADMLPSELREVVRECQKVNSHFFGMARRTGLLMEGLTAALPDSSGDSNETAPPS